MSTACRVAADALGVFGLISAQPYTILLTENNSKNNVIAVVLCAVFVVSWWRNKGLHTLNRMHNEVWGCAEIKPKTTNTN